MSRQPPSRFDGVATDGDCDTRQARPDPPAPPGPLGIHPRTGGPRKSGKTLSQPGRGPSADHLRNSVGRRVRKQRHGVGKGRPGRAHAGGGFDPRKLQDRAGRRIRGRAARSRLHLEDPARGSSARAGYFLPGALRRHFAEFQAKRKSGISAPRRPTGVRYRSPGRAIPQARDGASMPRAAACAPIGPCWKTARTSSFIPEITSTPIVPCRRAEAAERRKSGATS